jgi:hypothetical protein
VIAHDEQHLFGMLVFQSRGPHQEFNTAILSAIGVGLAVQEFLQDDDAIGVGGEPGVRYDLAERRAVSVNVA